MRNVIEDVIFLNNKKKFRTRISKNSMRTRLVALLLYWIAREKNDKFLTKAADIR